jgi:hypothetical protein
MALITLIIVELTVLTKAQVFPGYSACCFRPLLSIAMQGQAAGAFLWVRRKFAAAYSPSLYPFLWKCWQDCSNGKRQKISQKVTF